MLTLAIRFWGCSLELELSWDFLDVVDERPPFPLLLVSPSSLIDVWISVFFLFAVELIWRRFHSQHEHNHSISLILNWKKYFWTDRGFLCQIGQWVAFSLHASRTSVGCVRRHDYIDCILSLRGRHSSVAAWHAIEGGEVLTVNL